MERFFINYLRRMSGQNCKYSKIHNALIRPKKKSDLIHNFPDAKYILLSSHCMFIICIIKEETHWEAEWNFL